MSNCQIYNFKIEKQLKFSLLSSFKSINKLRARAFQNFFIKRNLFDNIYRIHKSIFSNSTLVLLLIFIIHLGIDSFSFGQTTYTSVASGNWNSDATWSGTGTPSATDNAIISASTTVTL